MRNRESQVFKIDFPKDCTQLTFTCSKLKRETQEKGIKYVQS